MHDFKVSFSGIPDEISNSSTTNGCTEPLILEVTMNITETIANPIERGEFQTGKADEALMAAEKQQIIDLLNVLMSFESALELLEPLLDGITLRDGEKFDLSQMSERVVILNRIFNYDVNMVAQYLETFQDRLAQFTLLIESRYGVGFKVPYNTSSGVVVRRLSDTDFTHRVFQAPLIDWMREDELLLETVSSPADRGGFQAQSSLGPEYADQLVRDMKALLKIFLPLGKRFGALKHRIIITDRSFGIIIGTEA